MGVLWLCVHDGEMAACLSLLVPGSRAYLHPHPSEKCIRACEHETRPQSRRHLWLCALSVHPVCLPGSEASMVHKRLVKSEKGYL